MTLNSFVVLRALRGKKKDKNAAFTIVELIAAIGVVTICMAAFVKIAHVARQQRDAGRVQQTAVDQVQNVLELLAAADPEQLTMGNVDLTPHETLIARSLPEGELLVTCELFPNDNAAVQTWRLEASASWIPPGNLPRRSVAFTRLLSKPVVIETPQEQVQEEEQAPEPETTPEETAAGNVSDRLEPEESPLVETTPEEGGEE